MTKEATPLWITPLLNYKQPEVTVGHYEVVQRVVMPSPHPNKKEAEIETSVENFIRPEGNVAWRRVAVRSGPSCHEQTMHASFVLPEDRQNLSGKSSIVCWAAFPEQPDHKLLCVLASATLLCIYDVYPKGKAYTLGGEGHSIPLPFEACGVYAIDDGQGLLLQRTETLEDNLAFDAQNRTWTSTGLQGEDEDDGFVLKAPPRPLRFRESTGTEFGSLSMPNNPTTAPSLFSLSHPLDDILPVSNIRDADSQNSPFEDVFEKILFVGVVRWVDPATTAAERKEHLQPICVTYHTHKKVHAIWEIKNSPPPPPQAPLWEVSSQWRSSEGLNSHLGVLQQDFDDMVLLEPPHDPNASRFNPVARKEALADALGVRKSPHKVGEHPRARNLPSRSANRPRAQKPSGTNLSLLSPLSKPATNETLMDIDTTVETATRPPLLSIGPFASLHPKIAMVRIYQEEDITKEASHIFLISNEEGSGTLTLCMVRPRDDDTSNPNEVVLCPLISARKGTPVLNGNIGQFQVVPVTTIPCVSAAPLQASPVPCCFVGQEKKRLGHSHKAATDMLLLHNDSQGQRKMTLCRNSMPIVDCAVHENSGFGFGIVDDIRDAVGNRIDLIIESGSSEPVCLRTRITLEVESNAVCEKVVQAVEATLCSPKFRESTSKGIEVALKIRADCVRMQQALLQPPDGRSAVDGDAASKAVGSVLCALLVLELLGKDVNNKSSQAMESSTPEMSAWELLLNSEYHKNYSSAECPQLIPPSASAIPGTLDTFWRWDDLGDLHSLTVECLKEDATSFAASVFDSMHAVYEDFKVYGSSRDEGIRFVGSILCQVCSVCPTSVGIPRDLFMGHYRRDLGDELFERTVAAANIQQESVVTPKAKQLSSHRYPPCIMSWVDSRVSCKNVECGYEQVPQESSLNAGCTRTLSVVRIFSMLYGDCDNSSAGKCERDRRVAIALIEEGFTDRVLLRDSLPAGVVVPLLEVLFRCRDEQELLDMPLDDPEMWSLIGRDDVYKNSQGARPGFSEVSSFKVDSLSALDLSDQSTPKSSKLDDKDKDGICPLEVTSSMLFPEDNRIREVGRLLRSSRPMYLNVPRAIEVTDHDYERMKQEKLLLLSRRSLALPLGRGMFTIGNLQPVPAEPLPLPEISLVSRVPPTNAMLALDTSEMETDMKVWPDFHNGVAAGLRLPLHMDSNDSISKITRTWIVYNRPDEAAAQSPNNGSNAANSNQPNPIHAYGGLLMALGLRGHLTALEMTDIFDYLTQGTVTTTVGVLLGMAVNMRGSCDVSVSKMLCLHIPSLIPQHFSAIDVASPVQAAAIAGAGLLYQGSSHRMMTEFLLNEIGKRPANDLNVVDREAYTLSCGIALGMVNLCRGEGTYNDGSGIGSAGLSDLRIEDRLCRYIVGGQDDAEIRRQREESDRLSLPSSSAANGNEKCSCIFEGNSINTHVTAPGATLALGLMYMMSGNTTIAAAIALPDTHFLLEYVRPDFLMLRVIARSLILWDDVKPSTEWIFSQLPKAAADGYEKMRTMAKNMSGGAPALVDEDQSFDRQAVRLIHVHVIAGACFSIGLRFAGTGNRDAAAAIFERVMELRDLRDGTDSVSCALRPPVPVLEMCLGCVAISLAMVMAGSGDLEVLRLLKVLRWRCDEQISYGSHLAFGTAIGLLFLGGGTCTLGREPEDIAALVMAFYPRFPASSTDNQYHLQALRNLYAIAVKERSFRAIDVDTGESVFVPLEVHFEDASNPPLKMTAPCLFFNTDAKPKELRVTSERYYPLTLSMNNSIPRSTIFVKRRSAHLSYLQDPHSQRSLLVQTGTFQGNKALDLIASFTDDQKVLAFAKHLCDLGQPVGSGSNGPFSVAGFCSRVLHESLLLDTQEALPLYLALRTTISSLQTGSFSVATQVWDFRIIKSYYEQRRQLQVSDSSPRLLNSEIVAYLLELLEKLLVGSGDTKLLVSASKASNRDGSVPIFFESQVNSLAVSSTSMDLS
ncbi:unnamed protein product [Cylindrotheca closterium]|uniref:Anaphase-promoting complex subunit 1 n=1 Tax=Cylindrotheca closterium TaxID=2856 RepID=A0AAD2GCK1_9STRA|nr:unnamed protein product [Cylindrotheca closterium]